jgi:hypothetical protein
VIYIGSQAIHVEFGVLAAAAMAYALGVTDLLAELQRWSSGEEDGPKEPPR